jgi:hypothetical protein
MSLSEFDYLITDLMKSRKSNAKDLIERIRRRSYELCMDKDDPGILVLYSKIKLNCGDLEVSKAFEDFTDIKILKERSSACIFESVINFAESISKSYPKIFWAYYIYTKYYLEDIYKMVVNRIHINSHFFMNCVRRNYTHPNTFWNTLRFSCSFRFLSIH